MGHVNFHVNIKCNFSKHMSRPAFTRTSNEELQIVLAVYFCVLCINFSIRVLFLFSFQP